MPKYIRCIIMDGVLTREELARGLVNLSPDLHLDGDFLMHGDLRCAVLEFNLLGDGVLEDDIELLHRYAEAKRNIERIKGALNQTSSMVVAQLLNDGLGEQESREVLAPLWQWLLKTHEAMLVLDDGQQFVDADGECV
ncbi:hypothetical protein GC197_17840 [bacterium]|nr:hypothetical protein [bacterium]